MIAFLIFGIVTLLVVFISLIVNNNDGSPSGFTHYLNVVFAILILISVSQIVMIGSLSFIGVHDTKNDVYIITDMTTEYIDDVLVTEYTAKSFSKGNKMHVNNITAPAIRFYDDVYKYNTNDTITFTKR